MSQQEQKPQWFWCNKHGDFAVRPICPECEHLGQAFTSSVTPAPPEASHRALREALVQIQSQCAGHADEFSRRVWQIAEAALSTGTETQEPR
jgi:hypothetical protein